MFWAGAMCGVGGEGGVAGVGEIVARAPIGAAGVEFGEGGGVFRVGGAE